MLRRDWCALLDAHRATVKLKSRDVRGARLGDGFVWPEYVPYPDQDRVRELIDNDKRVFNFDAGNINCYVDGAQNRDGRVANANDVYGTVLKLFT